MTLQAPIDIGGINPNISSGATGRADLNKGGVQFGNVSYGNDNDFLDYALKIGIPFILVILASKFKGGKK